MFLPTQAQHQTLAHAHRRGSGCKLSRTRISACFGKRKDKANAPRENLVNFAPGEEIPHALLNSPKRPYSTVKSFSMKIRPRRSFMFLDFPAADGLPPKADENRDHAHVSGFLQPRENQSKKHHVADKKLRQKITANSLPNEDPKCNIGNNAGDTQIPPDSHPRKLK